MLCCGRHDDQTWFALSPREITDLIYREIRIMDRERMLTSDGGFAAGGRRGGLTRLPSAWVGERRPAAVWIGGLVP